MNTYNIFVGCILLLAIFEIVQPTCVLESDFGFKINCAFKKSGLFRVRNLGGIKAHASLGFSLGDDLGFDQSLSNLDPNRRRSINVKNAPANIIAAEANARSGKQEKRGRIMMRPPPPPGRPNKSAMDKLVTLHRKPSSTMRPIIVGPTVETRIDNNNNPSLTIAKPYPMGVPPFRPLPPKEDTLKVLPLAATTKSPYVFQQVSQSKGPGLAYQSENYFPAPNNHMTKMVSHLTASHARPLLRITPNPFYIEANSIYSMPTTINPFIPMPISAPPNQVISLMPMFNSIQPQAPKTPYIKSIVTQKPVIPFSTFIDSQLPDTANMYPVYQTKKSDDYNSITGYEDDTMLKINKEDINTKIAELARAGNISMDAVEAAIALRKQQLLSKYTNIQMPSTTTTTTTTTTTESPFVFQIDSEPEVVVSPVPQKSKKYPTLGKVMNAPKEYYPVGYEKNFDDNFQSKVDLPETNFNCGDQKYFPGLYGDENLGCMVFHVCALTDDGLVMKSFLCPESTLFDQTILKCNWWFYVDCKNTQRLYDTNIPVSKSYQLMKALTFFSSYNKEMHENGGQTSNPEDVTGLKEAITILENQDSRPSQSDNGANVIEIITPMPFVDERSKYNADISNESQPVYRANRNYQNSYTDNSWKAISDKIHTADTKPKDSYILNNNSTVSNTSVDKDFKLITVNANFNIKKEEKQEQRKNSTISSAEGSDRKHRRRMTLKRNNTSTTTTTTGKTLNLPSSSEIDKEEVIEINNLKANEEKQETLADQIDEGVKYTPESFVEAAKSSPVKRFYRSSGEMKDNYREVKKFEDTKSETNSKEEKNKEDMIILNKEKIQIVRPSSSARLVGEFPTPTATIAKLDEAILGRSLNVRRKKEVLSIVTPRSLTKDQT